MENNRNKFNSEMINGISVVDISKVAKEEPKQRKPSMEKVAKLYLQKVEKKIIALTNEENDLEEAVRVMEETYKKLKDNVQNYKLIPKSNTFILMLI